MFLWKALPGFPSFASLIVFVDATLPVVRSTVEWYWAPTRHRHCQLSGALWRGMGHQCCIGIASGAVWGTNAASTLPAIRSTVELYGAPTRRWRCQPSGALWSSVGHQRGVYIACCQEHCGVVQGTHAVLTLPTVKITHTCWSLLDQ